MSWPKRVCILMLDGSCQIKSQGPHIHVELNTSLNGERVEGALGRWSQAGLQDSNHTWEPVSADVVNSLAKKTRLFACIQKGRLVKGISNTIPQLQVFELIICQPKGFSKFSKWTQSVFKNALCNLLKLLSNHASQIKMHLGFGLGSKVDFLCVCVVYLS